MTNPDQVALGQRFYREASGVVALYLIDTPAAGRLNSKAILGDPTAVRIMRNVGAWAARFGQLPERPKCLACGVEFKHDGEPAALVCTTPLVDGEWCVIAGMCATCAASGASGKAADLWKRQWPASTVVPTFC